MEIKPITKLIREILTSNISFIKEPFFLGVLRTLKARAFQNLKKK